MGKATLTEPTFLKLIPFFNKKIKPINTTINRAFSGLLIFSSGLASADYVAQAAEDGAFAFSRAACFWGVGQDSVAHP
jgi:hypothetical protein